MVLETSVQHLIAGTAGGMIATELVKTRMQVITDGTGTYRSLSKACQSVLRKEGIAGFYQGMAPALFAASGSWGGYFYFYESSKKRKRTGQQTDAPLGTFDHLASGVEAGVILVLLFNPMWVAKTRLAVQGAESGSQRRYAGTIDCLRTIAREEGLPGLYKGLVPALFLTSHGAVQFAIYEMMKASFGRYYSKRGDGSTPAWTSVVNGGASKIIASTITYPYQLVKSKLQQRDAINVETQQVERRYTGTLDCVRKVWRAEGLPGFFRGVVPNALKVAPSAALTFLVYEEAMKAMALLT